MTPNMERLWAVFLSISWKPLPKNVTHTADAIEDVNGAISTFATRVAQRCGKLCEDLHFLGSALHEIVTRSVAQYNDVIVAELRVIRGASLHREISLHRASFCQLLFRLIAASGETASFSPMLGTEGGLA